MATMTFGVHLLPKTTNTYTLGNSDQKWKIYATELNGTNMDNYVTKTGNYISFPHNVPVPVLYFYCRTFSGNFKWM